MVFLASCQAVGVGDTVPVEITVDFGSRRPALTRSIELEPESTALDALDKVADIVTIAHDPYVIVTAIDGVEAVKGESAWFYKVNGKSARTTANQVAVRPNDRIKWIFSEDRCSK